MRDDDFCQMNLFNQFREYKKFDRNKKLLVISFFSGIGATEQGLKNLGIPFISHRTCEWCSVSIKAFNLIHNKDFTDYSKDKTKEELIAYLDGNISTDWNTLCDVRKKPEKWLRETYNNCIANHNMMNISNVHAEDLGIPYSDEYEVFCSYSFPCQDISNAGLKKGYEEGSGTRSSLLFEFLRILEELDQLYKEGKSGRITYLLMENVPEIISSKHVKNFHKFEERLEKLNYTSFGGILNSRNYGIPQNRRRFFLMSILNDYSYDFPIKRGLKYHLKDFLEKEVDEKYYLSQEMIDFFMSNTEKQAESGNGFAFNPIAATDEGSIARTITTKAGSRMDDNFIEEDEDEEEILTHRDLKETLEGGVIEEGDFVDAYNRTIKKDGCSGTITTRISECNHQYVVVKGKTIKVKNATKKGYIEAEVGDAIDISGRMQYHRGTVQKGISQTITTMGGDNVAMVVEDEGENDEGTK